MLRLARVMDRIMQVLNKHDRSEVTIYNDNESLVDRTSEKRLHGNYGLHAAMATMIVIREKKKDHPNIKFK